MRSSVFLSGLLFKKTGAWGPASWILYPARRL